MTKVNHQHSDPLFIATQISVMKERGQTLCRCGEAITLHVNTYQCLYCKEWWCHQCAQDHFGMTIEEWEIKESQK